MSSFPLSKSDNILQNDRYISSSIMCRGVGLLQSPLLTTQALLLPPPPPLPPCPLARPQRLLLSPSLQKPMANLRSNVVPIGISTQSPFKEPRKRTRWEHLLGSMGQKAAKWSCPMSTSKVEIAVANDTTVPFSDISTQDMDRNILGKKARLAWGDGLANYEKQKVQGSSGAPVAGTKNEPGKMQGSQDSLMVGTKSDPGNTIGVVGPEFSGSSSQKSTLGDGVILGVDSKHDECTARLDSYPVKSVCALKPFLIDLLQPKDTYSGHSIYTTSVPFKQLLHLKAAILKELEQTECEIDSVERKIKSLSLNSGTKSPLILSTTAYVANKVFASSPPKDHVQPGGDYLRFQSKQEKHINTVNLEHIALADYDSRKLPVISSRCEEKLQNSNGMCCCYVQIS
ncbi:hypothetical protein GUJ93_ZPchr0009g1451 [Zizania palustris]|uniref:Uncharacterized protein n=1 Tax=Zizania palustris TaxID=103762 RepID=A0A8J5RS29_ZIZPA|nr:hypothetical protein GUJ93_ZPchr0009g1451 [Zizania palustris]